MVPLDTGAEGKSAFGGLLSHKVVNCRLDSQEHLKS